MIEQLVGMQAQNHLDPYYALLARIDASRPKDLSSLVESRAALRIPLLRSTIHLVTARDCLTMRPILGSVLSRTFGSVRSPKTSRGSIARRS